MPRTEHVDILVIGAGISGIAAARHLKLTNPAPSFLVLDEKPGFGGTWLTHTYPGARSDSDLYTFGYSFKPWIGPPIASAAEIRDYLGEAIDDAGVSDNIRYGRRVTAADWNSDNNLWTLDIIQTETGRKSNITTNFLWMCQGYYRHAQGYTPDWPGLGDFAGEVIHPQSWPDSFNGKDKNVVVIGSGATAATLVPNIANDCGHVTMLQRSPTYFLTAKNANDLADTLRDLDIDEHWIHTIVRKKIVSDQAAFTRRCFAEPETVKAELLSQVRAHLGKAYDIEKHFTPTYRPWRQRIAFIPDADLFKSIASGKASVVTDEIDHFTQTGIQLKSGAHLDADTVVTATGFNLCVLGDIAFSIDGQALHFNDTVTYRGMMFTGVPNLVWVFGYFRASWTLRAELVADFVDRLLAHKSARGAQRVQVDLRAKDQNMPIHSWADPDDFSPGYLMRGEHLLPKRGDTSEWMHSQDYWAEKDEFPAIDLDDEVFVYS